MNENDVFRNVGDDPDPEPHIEHALPWIYLANKPYLDWLFGGEALSKKVLNEWMRREVSEVSLKNLYLYFRDGEPYGGIVCLTGKDLVRARKADAVSLMTIVPREHRAGVLERLRKTAHLFDYPAEDQFYLAKMGVVAKARGTGIGKKIFGLSLELGESLGFQKFCGDVHVDNAPALRVYQSWGFEVGDVRRCEASGLAYVPVSLDRSRK